VGCAATALCTWGGESLTQLHTRVMAWLKDVQNSGVDIAIVVTHGDPLRVLLTAAENNPAAALNLQAPPWGSLDTLEITL
jgi:broad specificity phosphatase PhoE